MVRGGGGGVGSLFFSVPQLWGSHSAYRLRLLQGFNELKGRLSHFISISINGRA